MKPLDEEFYKDRTQRKTPKRARTQGEREEAGDASQEHLEDYGANFFYTADQAREAGSFEV